MKNKTLRIASYALVNVFIAALILRYLSANGNIYNIVQLTHTTSLHTNILTLILGIFIIILYGFRMSLLLGFKLSHSMQIVVLGFGLNSILPFRTGDILKIVLAKKFFSTDLSSISIATLIEKSIDLFFISTLAIFFSYTFINKLVFVAILTTLLIFLFTSKLFKSYLPNSVNIFANKIITKKNMIKILLNTLLIWIISIISFYIFFQEANTPDIFFDLHDATIMLVITTLTISIPSLPASLGLFESGIVVYLMKKFNMNFDQSVAYALTYHFLIIFPQIILALIIIKLNYPMLKKGLLTYK